MCFVLFYFKIWRSSFIANLQPDYQQLPKDLPAVLNDQSSVIKPIFRSDTESLITSKTEQGTEATKEEMSKSNPTNQTDDDDFDRRTSFPWPNDPKCQKFLTEMNRSEEKLRKN